MSLAFTKRQFDRSVSAIEVVLEGIVTLADARVLHKSLRHTLRQGYTTVVVNLRFVRDIDPAAWDSLIAAARVLRRTGGRIILRHCPDPIYDHLRAQRWDRGFLFPERCPADAAALPEQLREWALGDRDPEEVMFSELVTPKRGA